MTVAHALMVLLAAGRGEPVVDARAIAEIEPSPAGAAALNALDPKAAILERSARVGLWQLSTGNSAAVLATLDAQLPGHFAAVFHDERIPASKLRVPAGGVLVWLEPSTNAARWVEQHRLVVKQSFADGTLLVECAPGKASLELAATLRADLRVKQVMPNWWLRAVRK